MGKHELFQFTNNRSVRFELDSFALPVTVNKNKKNTIYTNMITGLKGTKRKLLPEPEPVNKHGYDYVAYWGNVVFGDNEEGLFYADVRFLNFRPLDETIKPHQLCIANNRLFLLGSNYKKLLYSVDLRTTWTPDNFIEDVINLPEDYGLCLDIRFYRNKLLLICQNGLLLIDKNINFQHLSDDSELLKTNLNGKKRSYWESDWFSLGYATNTQNLREIFLKTDVPLIMLVTSNRTKRTIRVKSAQNIQKIKINLNGDQFKISLTMFGNNFCISNLSAVIAFGKRGK